MTSPIDRPSDEPKCARSSVSWRFSPSPICLHSTRGVRGRSRIQSVRVGHDAPLGRTFSLLPGTVRTCGFRRSVRWSAWAGTTTEARTKAPWAVTATARLLLRQYF